MGNDNNLSLLVGKAFTRSSGPQPHRNSTATAKENMSESCGSNDFPNAEGKIRKPNKGKAKVKEDLEEAFSTTQHFATYQQPFKIVAFMVGVAIGALVIYCLIPKDGGKIRLTSPNTTLVELFKQHPPLSVEIHMPPSPPQLTSPNDSVEEPLQHPSPDNDSVEELPQLSSPPTLPTPSMPVPWRLPRVGGQYPPVGWYTRNQLEKKLSVEFSKYF